MKNARKARTKESVFVTWLKKIFTAQTITIFIGLVGLAGSYYAYRTYRDSRPSTLSIEYDRSAYENIHGPGKPKNVENIDYYCNLISTNYRMVPLSYYYYDGGFHGRPRIINRTRKSISNLVCKVTLMCYGVPYMINDFLSTDYEIVDISPNWHEIQLRYKYNTLAPWAILPHPIRGLGLPDSIPFSSDEFRCVDLLYEISYDGCEKSISFITRYYMFFDYEETESLNLSNKSKEWYLERIYDGCRDEGTLPESRFAMLDGTDEIEIKLPKNCSREEFEEYKNNILKMK